MPVYSNSRLSAFEKCPLQYKYRYIDRIRTGTEGIEAFLGKRVHETLEKLYRDLLMSRLTSMDELVDFYHGRWDTEYSDNVTIVRTEYTAGHYRSIGDRCIANYYLHYEPFDQSATLGLEERVHFALDPENKYRLQGFIDRLACAGPGIYEIHDYKTGSTLPSDQDLGRDRQLSLYQMAVQQRFPDAAEVRLIWHYLAFDQELRSSRTDRDLDLHRAKTARLIDRIEAATEYPPRESALCRWCEYRSICPTQSTGVRAADINVDRRPLRTTSRRRPEQIPLFD